MIFNKYLYFFSFRIIANGCRFDKKPAFRYSGCHAYDVSALNIVLGKMFNFDESKYIFNDNQKLFVSKNELAVIMEEEEESPD